jgi:hypothetical protein
MCAPSSSLTLLIWGAYRTLRGSGFEPLISRAVAGWQLGVPVLVTSAGFVGSHSSRPSKLLISNPLDSRAHVVPALTERVSMPLVSNRTLQGSGFSSPWLEPRGHLMTAVVTAIVRCGHAFSGDTTAHVVGDVGGGRDGPPQPFGCRAVMIAHVRASCRFVVVGFARQWQMQPPIVNARGTRARGSCSAAPPDL